MINSFYSLKSFCLKNVESNKNSHLTCYRVQNKEHLAKISQNLEMRSDGPKIGRRRHMMKLAGAFFVTFEMLL